MLFFLHIKRLPQLLYCDSLFCYLEAFVTLCGAAMLEI